MPFAKLCLTITGARASLPPDMSRRSAKKWPGGLPHRVSEAMYGPLFRAIATTGIGPSFIVTLETRGRRSGRVHSTVHIVAGHAGEDYLAAAVDYSDWVLNARASGGEATVRHGKRRAVKLEEVPLDQRAPILKSYMKRSLGGRVLFKLSPASPIEKFEEIAAKHPVFKILEV
jgi:hypothetical protein